eukprot:1175708-Prorocentrum_minimum.AAC.1
MQLCAEVSIYGVGLGGCNGDNCRGGSSWHYWQEDTFKLSREFTGNPHHSFELEHDMLRALDAGAVINLIAPQRASDVSSENQKLRDFMPQVRPMTSRRRRGLLTHSESFALALLAECAVRACFGGQIIDEVQNVKASRWREADNVCLSATGHRCGPAPVIQKVPSRPSAPLPRVQQERQRRSDGFAARRTETNLYSCAGTKPLAVPKQN